MAGVEVIKSPADDRGYSYFQLENGLKCLAVHDAETDKAAASLNVNVGSLYDPLELPGLAHFLEHMLFLGTKKYPGENDYSSFIQSHGGMTNAFTQAAHTNFYFDISHDFLEGALDRFAQFFYEPLFNQSCTDREINAVDSENNKNLSNDHWRLHQLDKATSDPGHPYEKFSTGNKVSLLTEPASKGIQVREELLKFHDTWYSANIMTLVVLGREPLDKLEATVRELFSGIVNKDVTTMAIPAFPHQNGLRKRINVAPVKDLRFVTLEFPCHDQRLNFKSQPGHYLAHLIGHEGAGSLLSFLKDKGWATGLMAGDYEGWVGGFGAFKIRVSLSEKGLGAVDDVVAACFQYIRVLQRDGLHDWVFQECQQLLAMSFRFINKAQPAGYVRTLSRGLHFLPPENALNSHFALEEFRPDLIKGILDELTPQNLRLMVVSKAFSGQTTETEKWYQTPYSALDIDESLIKAWSEVEPEEGLHMPPRNQFLPTDFDVREPAVADVGNPEAAFPRLLKSTKTTKLWYKLDTTFQLPKLVQKYAIGNAIAYVDPFRTNLTAMFVSLLSESLAEFAYDAELGGIQYGISNNKYGLEITLRGFAHKQGVLLQTIVDHATNLDITEERFLALKDLYRRQLSDFKSSDVYRQVAYAAKGTLTEVQWSHAERLDELEAISLKDVLEFGPQLLAGATVECLIHGNASQAEALALAGIVEAGIRATRDEASGPATPREKRMLRQIEIPPGHQCVTSEHSCPDLHAVELYSQIGVEDMGSNARSLLFSQIVSDPCFDTLRTKEQLGYIVFSGGRRQNGCHGFRVLVQSDRPAAYLVQRIASFLHSVKALLEEMTEEAFQTHVAGIVSRLLVKPQSLSEEAAKHWSEIACLFYIFNRDEEETELIKTLTKQDILEFYDAFVDPRSATARHLSIFCVPEEGAGETPANEGGDGVKDGENAPEAKERLEDEAAAAFMDGARLVSELDVFKNSLQLMPRPKPREHVFVSPSPAS